MKKISSVFSSLQDKLHRDKGEKKGLPPPADAAAPPVECSHMLVQPPFFEYLVVVSVRKRSSGDEGYEPQIIYQFPKATGQSQRKEEEPLFKAITLFCFPEGVNWAPLTEYHSETFSFVLTGMDGSRRNGYCRRLLPLGKGARPPEAYCIISTLACFSLFSKIFDEVEKRRQISMAMIYPFMQSLRETPFPAPGKTATIKSFIPESGTEIISLTRPVDSWLEHVDFCSLFLCLSDEEILQVFAAAVLERRIIFIAEELSTLSQVLHAVAALLFPFIWQHTFISIVPKVLLDVYLAPTPYLLGIQKNLLHLLTEHTDVGDEDTLIPSRLQEELLQDLCKRKHDATTEELNSVVSEAFLSFFVKTVGHFANHFKHLGRNKQLRTFQKKSFIKAVEPKENLDFVKQFVQTQMFDLFIQEEEKPHEHEGFFHQKVVEFQQRRKERLRSGGVKGLVA
ncbi:DENN/MADD domain containing 2Db isoform X2 [Neoarius graeffei]|uniref:DENN/MADD domain containing 2Db isoform X2 n=1 Tax=Neoarius graeffei TaxID=443677 RepID=UPI00298D43A6|nr:DENN/MADD domain containing 2Db isoform X2 [Neoarius graeffei]